MTHSHKDVVLGRGPQEAQDLRAAFPVRESRTEYRHAPEPQRVEVRRRSRVRRAGVLDVVVPVSRRIPSALEVGRREGVEYPDAQACVGTRARNADPRRSRHRPHQSRAVGQPSREPATDNPEGELAELPPAGQRRSPAWGMETPRQANSAIQGANKSRWTNQVSRIIRHSRRSICLLRASTGRSHCRRGAESNNCGRR